MPCSFLGFCADDYMPVWCILEATVPTVGETFSEKVAVFYAQSDGCQRRWDSRGRRWARCWAERRRRTCFISACVTLMFDELEKIDKMCQTPLSKYSVTPLFRGDNLTYWRRSAGVKVMNQERTRMWANSKRDGCPYKCRWRPVFNAVTLADAHYSSAVQ